MKKIGLMIFGLMVSGIMIMSAQTGDWVVSKTESYSILFPAEPTLTELDVPTELGVLKVNFYLYEVPANSTDSNLVYSIASTQYPDSTVSSDYTDLVPDILRSGVDGAATNVGGTLISESDITVEGFPGKTAKIDLASNGAIITAQFILVKDVMYIIQVISKSGQEQNAASQKFIAAFDLL